MKPFPRCLLSLILLVLCHGAVAQTPVQLVQAFLDARAAGQYDKAYALLSPKTQAQVPMDKFSSPNYVPPQVSFFPEKAKLLNERLAPVYAFFLDPHDTQHCAFRVAGPAPDTPGGVRLTAQVPGAPSGHDMEVIVAAVSENDDPLRLDLLRSLDGTLRHELERARQAVSHSNLRVIALGVLQYALDHNEHLPDASRWTDKIMPYMRDRKFFHDPSASGGPFGGGYSYAFNRALSGKRLAKVAVPYSTVMLFETTKTIKNASDTGQSVPRPGRHEGGTDYAFADGHVKWVRDGGAKVSYLLSGQ